MTSRHYKGKRYIFGGLINILLNAQLYAKQNGEGIIKISQQL